MLSSLRKSKLAGQAILLVFAFSLLGATPSPTEEHYPAVARLSFVSGEVTYSRGDDPDEWDDALENVPLTVGDRIYAPDNSRAEVQLSSGNFVRLAPRSYLSTLNLSDDVKQFYLGEGAASFNIRRLPANEVFEIDTPNVSVTFEEPGRYRVAIDDNGDSRITVRRGRAVVAASGRQITVENSEIRVYGIDSPRYEIVGLPASDNFDRWVGEREDRYDRAHADAYRYASEDIVGAEDLAGYGRWEEIPEYGYAWTPTVVATGWAPFSNGRWYWQDPWGWSWISNERWGWATSHYGRWTPHRSRWYWVPARPRSRVRYAPACVEFVRVRDHVGWFPLHPRDRHIPWWERRDRRFDRNVTYVNRNYVTVVNHNHFISARPVHRYIVRDQVIIRDARSARFSESLPIPNRSSLRLVSDSGVRRGYRPSDNVLNRVAVVRTAPPAPPRAFRNKLPEIEKNQGKAVEPSKILAAAEDDRSRRVRVRPAAETARGDFAPRNPGTNTGPALQPVTEARGKKLATRDVRDNDTSERAQKTPAPQQAVPQAESSKGSASSSEPPRREQERDPKQDKQAGERRPAQEIERQKRAQQKEEERKAQLQKQQQERERQTQEQKERETERRQAPQKDEERKTQAQKQPQERQQANPSREQLRLEELERQQRERERKAQAQQNRQEQERREQLKQQQERQAQQQRQQELQRREQAIQQPEQARREQQLRQQQAQERQARDLQRQQQEIERRQQQQERAVQSQQREQQVQERQLRQQQQQAQREAQQLQRQQEQQDRRPQPRRPQPQEVPVPQPMPQVPR
jgi:hypothetical protein